MLVALEQRLQALGVLQVGHGDQRAHALVAPLAQPRGQRPQQLLVLLGARPLQLDRQIAVLLDGEADDRDACRRPATSS